MYSPTANQLTSLKLQLGINDASQDQLLNQLLTQTGTKVLNEINQSSMPADLEPIIVEMTADAYRFNQSEIIGAIGSVSDNGQSVSYDQSIIASVSVVLKDYMGQLARFRMPGW